MEDPMEDPRSMSAEALQAAIEEERRRTEAAEARFAELDNEVEQAFERQRLRDELSQMRSRRESAEVRNDSAIELRGLIDEDKAGWGGQPCMRTSTKLVMQASGGESAKFDGMVAKGEYVWRMEGFSWVPCALEQKMAAAHATAGGWVPVSAPFVNSHFELGNQEFLFRYSPWAHELHHLSQQHHGSLAIVLDTQENVALRYRIFVRARGGQFVQWGETCNVVHHGNRHPLGVYGPDVHWPDDPPASVGIFGLSHEELLQSEWVENDTLTLKFELEVRPNEYATTQRLSLAAEVPEPTILEDTRALLEEGTCSDVSFMVQDEVIQAHSQVLCARSEVFRKQLTAGWQESVSKIVKIEDCDVSTFKTFLQFLYTDRLPDVQEILPTEPVSGFPQLSRIQAFLAVSHKYGVTRLQLWCEAKLSEQVDTSQVCGLLGQAHLLQAKQLEKSCLSFIKNHAAQVLTLPAYTDLVKKWPQIGLKVSLFAAGVSGTELSAAMACLEKLEKPQRQESEQEQATASGSTG